MVDRKILAVIPARGGSKRLPNKNILNMAGRPLIRWTIDCALDTQLFEDVVVSSDSQEVLAIAEEANVIALKRPERLASDSATSVDVVLHALESFRDVGKIFHYVCLLQPTSPLKESGDIAGAFALLDNKSIASVVSVTEVDHSPMWSMPLDKGMSLDQFFDQKVGALSRSQDLEKYYRLNGAIYFSNVRALEQTKRLSSAPCLAYLMPRNRSFDIDEKIDFDICEFLLKKSLTANG